MSRHKYGAVATTVDGIRFASRLEAARYRELRLLERAGEIRLLELQPAFVLHAGGLAIGRYVADFGYYTRDGGEWRVEDVKGMDVPFGRWKRRHCEAEYGITVMLVTKQVKAGRKNAVKAGRKKTGKAEARA